MDTSAPHRLTIGRLRSTYLVARDHPAPERVRAELDEIARKHIVEAFGHTLSEQLDARDPSVWLIDKVQVDVLMDLGIAAAGDVGVFWARQMVSSVVETMARGDDGEHVIHFASRIEYLAWLLRELASGKAWSRWYFDQFAPLRSLTVAAAIREALLREPHLAEPVLLHLLRSHSFSDVAALLSRMDCDRLLDVCASREETPTEACLQAALAVWLEARPSRLDELEWYLRIRNDHPMQPPAEVRCAVEILTILETRAREARLHSFLTACAQGRWGDALPNAGPREARLALDLAALLRAAPARVFDIAEAMNAHIAPTTPNSKYQEEPQSGSQISSLFGGVFFLLPALLDHREFLAAVAGPNDADLRYLLLLSCLGPHAKDAENDPAILLAAAVDSSRPGAGLERARTQLALDRKDHDLLPGDVEYCAAADSPASEELSLAAAIILRRFARRLPGLGRSSFDYLWRNILSGESRITQSPGRIVIELAPRPLQIVLRMAGYSDLILALPWYADTELILRFAEQ